MPKVAVVTGGASGIGRSICAALVRRGDTVVIADLEADAAAQAASALSATEPGDATGIGLDVRDADAVATVVRETADRNGGLDLLFNNAGVAIGGNAEELTLAHWQRAIDVNLNGVVHGVQAAYPLMVRQGRGHIVNTASLGGVIPEPMATPYAAAKHGVVGLSLSLRCEAASRGVRVTAVCPGVVDTPIFERGLPADLAPVPSMADVDAREAFLRLAGGQMYSAERMAADVLRGVDRNKAIVVAPRRARTQWRLARWLPGLVLRIATAATARERQLAGAKQPT